MSGRTKRGPASPEEEREQLRQLTRELHEAAQDARAAARELRDRRREIAEDLTTRFQPVITKYQKELQDFVNRQVELLSNDVLGIEGRIQQTFAVFMGATTPAQLMDLIIEQTAQVVVKEMRSIALQQHAAPSRTEVRVGTQEQLDAFIAGGGDPGIVLDARS